jgi:hypothetical protein
MLCFGGELILMQNSTVRREGTLSLTVQVPGFDLEVASRCDIALAQEHAASTNAQGDLGRRFVILDKSVM